MCEPAAEVWSVFEWCGYEGGTIVDVVRTEAAAETIALSLEREKHWLEDYDKEPYEERLFLWVPWRLREESRDHKQWRSGIHGVEIRRWRLNKEDHHG